MEILNLPFEKEYADIYIQFLGFSSQKNIKRLCTMPDGVPKRIKAVVKSKLTELVQQILRMEEDVTMIPLTRVLTEVLHMAFV